MIRINNINIFVEELRQWANERLLVYNNEVMPQYQEGGWEAWVQVELTMWLRQRGYDVARECQCYTTNSYRADLCLNATQSIPPKLVIEIKCQSINSTLDSMIRAINDDAEKGYYLGGFDHMYELVFVYDQRLFEALNQYRQVLVTDKIAILINQVK